MKKVKATSPPISSTPFRGTKNEEKAREIGKLFAQSLISGVKAEQRSMHTLDIPDAAPSGHAYKAETFHLTAVSAELEQVTIDEAEPATEK